MGPEGFEAWYVEAQPRIVRSIWAACGDRELALDVTDEAFTRAVQHWRRVSTMQSPTGWAQAVAMNVLRRTMRRRAFEARLLLRRRVEETTDPTASDDDVWNALRLLPRRQREVVALRYIADFTEAETAAALGITEGAASSSLSKARQRLAAALSDTIEART